MRANLTLMSGIGLGAAAMYLIDPVHGSRPRALVRDAAVRGARKAGDAAGATGRDLRHRAEGLAARLRRRGDTSPVDDGVLVERVRAKLGRYSAHPRALDVSADEGVVILSGPLLRHEHRHLLSAVRSVRGVRDVRDDLELHDEPGNIPSLQGGTSPTGEPYEFWQREWTPAVRSVSGVAGAVLAGVGIARRDTVGVAMTMLGAGLAARAATNLETSRLVGIGAGRRAVDVQKTITIGAPVERVFDTWRRFQQFPEFTSRVRNVEADVDGRSSRWTILGPGHLPIGFEAVVTDLVPNERLAWKTTRRGAVRHAGVLRFEPDGAGGTRLHLRMSYNPPGGAIAHAAAAAVGQDLRSLLDEEILRIKTFIETGRAPHDAARKSPQPAR